MNDGWSRERMLESLDAYSRGLSQAPIIRTKTQQQADSAPAANNEGMTFVLSNEEVDRHGDVVMVSGWHLEAYRKNPVFLWAHDYARPVIGKAVSLWQEPGRLMAKMEFAPTEFAEEVATLYRNNYQQGVSVGFRPIRFEERRHQQTGAFLGIRFLEQELLEVSAVPVPANRAALRRALELTPRVGHYWKDLQSGTAAEAVPDEVLWPQVASRVDDLEKLVTELGELLAERERAGEKGLPGPSVRELLDILGNARG